jgi:phosphoserine aminotransferase
VSHRGEAFRAMAAAAEADLRQLLGVPPDYRVLFLPGGATLQFAGVPMNLAAPGQAVDYVDTGLWSAKAIDAARPYADVKVVASTAAGGYRDVPEKGAIRARAEAVYLHYTANETIGGVEFPYVPEASVPLVVDASSTILSRPFDVAAHGLIYAGAQKNIGPSGLTLVIVREDLLGRASPLTPAVLDYARQAADGSMLNTPPTFAWYLAGLVFRWLIDQGGVAAMATRNERKARLLYEAIDGSDFYRCPVAPRARSWMNVPFLLRRPELDATFLKDAAEAGLVNLAGHRLAGGGMRASLYNAMPEEGVRALVAFLHAFAQRHA